jgi:hypothetical protein
MPRPLARSVDSLRASHQATAAVATGRPWLIGARRNVQIVGPRKRTFGGRAVDAREGFEIGHPCHRQPFVTLNLVESHAACAAVLTPDFGCKPRGPRNFKIKFGGGERRMEPRHSFDREKPLCFILSTVCHVRANYLRRCRIARAL